MLPLSLFGHPMFARSALLGHGHAFMAGAHAALTISAAVLLAGAAAILARRSEN